MANTHSLAIIAAAATAVMAQCSVSSDAQTAISAIQKVGTVASKTTSDVNAFKGSDGPMGALPIQTDSTDLLTATKAATDALNNLDPNACDSAAIADAINGVGSAIAGALSALVSKKADFATAGVTSIVTTDLNQLAAGTTAFEAATVSAVTCDIIGSVAGTEKSINDGFAAAGDAFGASTVVAPQATTCAGTAVAGTSTAAAGGSSAAGSAGHSTMTSVASKATGSGFNGTTAVKTVTASCTAGKCAATTSVKQSNSGNQVSGGMGVAVAVAAAAMLF